VFIHENDIIIIIYVMNDLLILESNIFDIQALKLQFAERFQMKDLGSIGWYLGMHITRDRAERILWINQTTYIKRVIELLGMSECSPTKTPMHHKCQLKKDVYWKSKEWVEYQATPEEIGGYQSIIVYIPFEVDSERIRTMKLEGAFVSTRLIFVTSNAPSGPITC